MQKKEFTKLEFNDQEITINRVWGGHRFTDAELKKLASGSSIHITAKKASGEEFECDGNIQKQEYNGYTFWGFKLLPLKKKEKATGTFEGKEISFNKVWGNHRFTDQEITDLLSGKQISFKKTSQRGTEYTVTGKLEHQNFEGKSFWGFKRTDNENVHSDNKPISPQTTDKFEVNDDDLDELF